MKDGALTQGPAHDGPAAGPLPVGPFVMRIVDIQHAMAKPLPGVDACFVPLSGEAAA
eukprot:CAMPEP_0206147664 /NCGR_PEP_ID=MMETSP1473-20131121/34131_1 /ASSEMBLY_ACC=CAM_ASM_001109 /TAXON_ID=1461547 /ORGANISM="Stichococcus sp, Strain RCC1054" /LENGTH=56 /DNA_ID=CAMNT_0053544689 /DNA_START=234 /DNA_END=400 /DNA_ORIENTATION=+